jgi:hypothetical protein
LTSTFFPVLLCFPLYLKERLFSFPSFSILNRAAVKNQKFEGAKILLFFLSQTFLQKKLKKNSLLPADKLLTRTPASKKRFLKAAAKVHTISKSTNLFTLFNEKILPLEDENK